MDKLLKSFFLIITLLILNSCNKKGYGDLSPYSDDGILQCIVSIEAGTSIPFVYDKQQKGFKSFKRDGETELIQFLPPPFNLGLIPSSDKSSDYLETLIITQGYKIGTRIKFLPIGSINYEKNGQEKIIIVGKPYAETARVIDVNDIKQLKVEFPDAITIIELWLKNNNYKNLNWNGLEYTNNLLNKRLPKTPLGK